MYEAKALRIMQTEAEIENQAEFRRIQNTEECRIQENTGSTGNAGEYMRTQTEYRQSTGRMQAEYRRIQENTGRMQENISTTQTECRQGEENCDAKELSLGIALR